MSTEQADAIRQSVTQALARLLPTGRDEAWIEQLVGPSRFGWDWHALERGFFEPFHHWAADHPARSHPVLTGLVVEGLGEPIGRYADVLAVLELEYLAAIMLDDIPNARDLGGAVTEAVKLALPAWVTVAYNIRQLVPVLITRQDSALSADQRRWLAQRCARFLFGQGIGNTLDLWGGEQGPDHDSPDGFLNHLRLHSGNLSFGLACDFASAILRLDSPDSDRLRVAGIELGVAHHLSVLATESSLGPSSDAARTTGPVVRWRQGVDPVDLPGLADGARERALALAEGIRPAVADAFEGFLAISEPMPLKGGQR